MADTKYYAWSRIRYGAERDKTDPTVVVAHLEVQPGDEVTREKLDMSKEQWKELLESGSIRTVPFPDMPEGYSDSPVNWYREQARKAAEGIMGNVDASDEMAHNARMAVAASSGVGAEAEGQSQ